MRLLKPFLITLIGLSLVLLAVSALLPSRVMTSRWVMVHADRDSVLTTILDLNDWSSWNLLLKDAGTPQPYKENHAKGDHLKWSLSGGTELQADVEEVNDKGIEAILRIGDQKAFRSGFSVEKRQADSVQVVWYVIEDLKWYPWEKVYGMMASDIKGPLMQKSLDHLKAKLEH
jgi:hypothetical protein